MGIKRVLTPPSCNQPQGSSGHSSKSGVGIHFISSFEQRRPGLKDYSKILPHKQPACRLTLPRRSQSTKHTQLIPRLIIITLPSNRCFTHTKTILRQRSTDHITRAGRLKGIASQACSGQKIGQLPYGIMRAAHKTLRHTYVVSTVTGLCKSKICISNPSFIVPADRPREGMPYGAL